MDPSLLGFAVAAGLVAALNPCGFAMLPAYLALVVLGADSPTTDPGTDPAADGGARPRGRVAAVGRALLATGFMALGFVLVFGVFGLVVAPLASSLQRYLPYVTVVVGALMVVLGGWLLAGRELTVLVPRSRRGAPTRRLGSMFGYGIGYALASLSCTIGPFLAVVSATFGTGSTLGGIAGFLAYGIGMALTVGILAVVVALLGYGAATRARRLLPYLNRACGALLVLVGLYVGYYGVYALRLDSGGADGTDPVIGAAEALQQTLSGWVDAVGALPIAAALVVIVALVLALARWRRHRTAAARPQADEHPASTRQH